MMTRAAELIKTVKSRIGPLAWGTIVVTLFLRMGDVVSLVTKVVAGKWLDTIEFGAIEPVASVLAFVAIPAGAIYQTGVKSISRLLARGDRAGFNGLIHDLARVAVIGSLLSIAAIVVGGEFILSRLHLESTIYLVVLGGMFVLVWWAPLAQAFLQGTRKFHLMAINVVVAPPVVLLCTVLFIVVMGWGLPGALAAKVIGPAAACIVFWFAVRKTIAGERSRYQEEHAFIKATLLPMLFYLAIHWALLHFDRIFIRSFMEEHSGGYCAVITIGQIPMWFIAPASFVLFPLASGEHATGKDVAKFYRQAMLFGIAVTVCCVGFFYFAATPLLRVWRPAFAPYGSIVWVYTLAMGLQAIIDVVARVEMSKHRYSFLWFMGVPTVAMCIGMRVYEKQMSLSSVLATIIAVRVAIVISVVLMARLGMKSAPHCRSKHS